MNLVEEGPDDVITGGLGSDTHVDGGVLDQLGTRWVVDQWGTRWVVDPA